MLHQSHAMAAGKSTPEDGETHQQLGETSPRQELSAWERMPQKPTGSSAFLAASPRLVDEPQYLPEEESLTGTATELGILLSVAVPWDSQNELGGGCGGQTSSHPVGLTCGNNRAASEQRLQQEPLSSGACSSCSKTPFGVRHGGEQTRTEQAPPPLVPSRQGKQGAAEDRPGCPAPGDTRTETPPPQNAHQGGGSFR